MDEVADDMFVGTEADASDEGLLRTHSIDVVVSLTHATPETGAVARVDAPMMDGPRNSYETFVDAVRTVVSKCDSGESVLIHCSAGSSRSPAVAATAMTYLTDLSLTQAFTKVRDKRPETDPHDALVRRAVTMAERSDVP